MAKNGIFPTPQRSFGSQSGFSHTPFRMSVAPTPLKIEIASDNAQADHAGECVNTYDQYASVCVCMCKYSEGQFALIQNTTTSTQTK